LPQRKEVAMAAWPNPEEIRQPARPIEPIFVRRWSPRAMSGARVGADDLATVFEAARWAPSTYNEQEWRFLYAHREGPHWQTFFDLLAEGNQAWCQRAGVLVVVLSHRVFSRNGKPNPVHTFDAGSAFENLALQGCSMGLVVHGMMGFDYDRAKTALAVPDDYAVEAMVAIGHPGDPDDLPEALRKMEVPSQRKPVAEIAREGAFAF
jgi:nitroreductase